MENVRETKSFLWNTGSLLGKGASGSVFSGYHKEKGLGVAIKDYGPRDSGFLKEVRILNELDHDNIIKLYGVEKLLTGTQHYVIALEYYKDSCSVFDFLQMPENRNGVNEKEFLVALHDITAAEEYLRSKELIHRDWKPGNIVRCVQSNGKPIYKLVDFGAARQLKDGEEFESLVATPAYMHARMHFEGMLVGYHNFEEKGYKATFDLWLIGATLYHILTSDLPFTAPTAKLRQVVLNEKPSGAITGQYNGSQIVYRRHLPKSCLLGLDMRCMMEHILASMLENEDRLVWGFKDYFEAVNKVLSLKAVYVFYVNLAAPCTVYIRENATWSEFNEKIVKKFHISESEFSYIFDSQIFSHPFERFNDSVTQLETSFSKPLVLLDCKTKISSNILKHGIGNSLTNEFDSWVSGPINEEPLTVMSKSITKFESNHDSKRDYLHALKCCCAAHSIKRFYEKVSGCPLYVHIASTHGMSIVVKNKDKLTAQMLALQKSFDRLQAKVEKHKSEDRLISKLLSFTNEMGIDCHLETKATPLEDTVCQVNDKIFMFESKFDSIKAYIERHDDIEAPCYNPSTSFNWITTCIKVLEDTLEYFKESSEKELSTALSAAEKMIFAAKKKEFELQCNSIIEIIKRLLDVNCALYKDLEPILKSQNEGVSLYKECEDLITSIELEIKKCETVDIEQDKVFAANIEQLSNLNFSSANQASEQNNQNCDDLNLLITEKLSKLESVQKDMQSACTERGTVLNKLKKEQEVFEDLLKKFENTAGF